MRRRWRVFASFVAALILVSVAGAAQSVSAVRAPVAGGSGTDTSLPPTDSAVTVSGRGRFASLRISVNQTERLTNQAVSITWTGGTPTVQGPGRFAEHYLQIFQCWGDDDGTVPDNPGPPPEQCVQGAVGGNYSGPPSGIYPNVLAMTRVIYRSGWAGYDPAVGHTDTRSGNVWMPFRSVTGEVVDVQVNPQFNPAIVGGNYWLNPFFNEITTNEIPGAVSDASGRGAELFQVNTGIESTGLGCGQFAQSVPGGGRKIPKCWIVVVPRGSAADENAGTPFGEFDPSTYGVATSPLSPLVWPNRIAIPISFNQVDSPCDISKQDRRIAGSELALTAVSSWQPALCAGGSLPPFSFALVGDDQARGQISNPVEGGPGLAVVSAPVASASTDPTKPLVYAPLTASGVVIGFNIERVPQINAPPAAQALAGVRVAEVNLTPRLIAKLLTQSYVRAIAIGSVIPTFPWLENNALHLGSDPDFLRFNPEFELLQITNPRNFSSLSLPSGTSDVATQIWKYVLADPEAKEWLNGTPDPWGMRVNPVYSTSPELNPEGVAFGDPVPNSFPKNDPYCYQAPVVGSVTPAPLCGTDWAPYSRGLADGAQIARAATDGAKVDYNPFAATPADAWKRETPQALGYRSVLALTDTASASRMGLQVARLSRAGDNGGDRGFVAPDTAGLTAGLAAMVAGVEPTVLEVKHDAVAPGAYPLTMLTYAVVSPLSLSRAARADYASFIRYAVQDGQQPGRSPGTLPPGYVSLPPALQTLALESATKIVTLVGTNGGGGGGGFVPPAEPSVDSVPDTTAAPAVPTTAVRDVTDAPTEEGSDDLLAEQAATPGAFGSVLRFLVIFVLVLLGIAGITALALSGNALRWNAQWRRRLVWWRS